MAYSVRMLVGNLKLLNNPVGLRHIRQFASARKCDEFVVASIFLFRRFIATT